MRGFIRITRADIAGTVLLGVNQIASIEAVILHRRDDHLALITMGNGRQFQTVESMANVLDLIAEATAEPIESIHLTDTDIKGQAMLDAYADPKPTPKKRGRPPKSAE